VELFFCSNYCFFNRYFTVEYDAVIVRWHGWKTSVILTQQEQAGAKDVKWAATYTAALGSIATLLYYISIYGRSSRRELDPYQNTTIKNHFGSNEAVL
jgi:hypothetical protein